MDLQKRFRTQCLASPCKLSWWIHSHLNNHYSMINKTTPGIRTVNFVIDETHARVELAPCLRTDLEDIAALNCRSASDIGGLAEIVIG